MKSCAGVSSAPPPPPVACCLPAAAAFQAFASRHSCGSAHCLPCRAAAGVSKQLVKLGLVLSRKWAKGAATAPLIRLTAPKRTWLALRLSAACNLAHTTVSATLRSADATTTAATLRCVDLVVGPACSVLQNPPVTSDVVVMLLNSAGALLKALLMLADARHISAQLAELAPPGALLAFLAAATAAANSAAVALCGKPQSAEDRAPVHQGLSIVCDTLFCID